MGSTSTGKYFFDPFCYMFTVMLNWIKHAIKYVTEYSANLRMTIKCIRMKKLYYQSNNKQFIKSL